MNLNSKMSETKWSKLLSRDDVDITTISQVDIVFYELIKEATGSNEELFFTIMERRKITHYIGIDQDIVGRYVYKKYFNNKEQIIKYYERGIGLIRENEIVSKKWELKLDVDSSNTLFLSAFCDFKKSFEEVNYIYSITSWFGIDTWQKDFDKILGKLIKENNLKKEIDKIYSSVYKPWKKTALIEIQEKIKSGENVDLLVEEYQFLRDWTAVWNKPITEEWIIEIGKTKEKEEENLFSLEELISLLHPDENELSFLEMAQYMTFFKDWRDDLRRKHAYSWSFLFELIENKYNLEKGEIGYLAIDEIETYLKFEEMDYSIIEKRREICVIGLNDNSVDVSLNIYEGDIPEKYFNIKKDVYRQSIGNKVSGKIAQRGVVQGYVKTIQSHHDIKKIYEDHILVANTTHPSYLPAMKKAAAFITNEGGMISHAAIIARELKKPCIVGTKNATRILKDGDFVEVDANNGIVKILERAKES